MMPWAEVRLRQAYSVSTENDIYHIFSDIKPLQSLAIAARFAQLCLICYDISIYTHLVISLNRYDFLQFFLVFKFKQHIYLGVNETCSKFRTFSKIYCL